MLNGKPKTKVPGKRAVPKFEGFEWPEENWVKMPKCWINLTRRMLSCEKNVLEYVLFHTWGYSDGRDGNPKRISLDEFQNGRKLVGGGRVDEGTGMSIGSIRRGIKLAVRHGLLEVHKVGDDKARMKHYYNLVMKSQEETPQSGMGISNSLGSKICSPDCEKIPHGLAKITNRSKEEAYRKIKGGRNSVTPRTPSLLVTSWDKKGAAILRSILDKYGSDLVNPGQGRRSVRIDTLAKNFYRLRQERQVSKSRIKEVLRWLEQNYDDEFCPKMRKGSDLADNWKRFEEAMLRSRRDQDGESEHEQNGVPVDMKLVRKVRIQLTKMGLDVINGQLFQEEIDEALEQLGKKPGTLKAGDF